MAKIVDLLKWFIFSLLVICTKCSNAKLELNEVEFQANLFDFDELKHNLFTFDIDKSELKKSHISPNDRKCLEEIDAIKNGLKHRESWAIKSKLCSKPL